MNVIDPCRRRHFQLRSSLLWLLPAILLVAADCAKTGDPQPPLVLIPKPASDLSARQYADCVALTVSMPTENTDGSPVTTLDRIELLRVSGSRGDTGPLPEEEFMKRAEAIALPSAEQLPAYLRDGQLVFRDEIKVGARPLYYSRTFRYAVRFINRKNQTAGLSNQAAIAPVPVPLPPATINFAVSQESIRVNWPPAVSNADGSTPPNVAGYNIYRAEGEDRFPAVPQNARPVADSFFEDRAFEFGKTYRYVVSVVASAGNPYAESSPSMPFSVTARDVFPPGAPANLNAVADGPRVILLWAAPEEPDVAGYRVYRRDPASNRPERLEPDVIKTLSYRDEKVQVETKYVYSVTAVDGHGNEGPPAEAIVEVK